MKKRILSLMLASSMALSLVGCGKQSKNASINEVMEESQNDSYSYNISALLSEDNTYNQVLLKGFTDCLTDYLGEDHFSITTSIVSEDQSSESIAQNAVATSPDMIFTAGKSTLLSAKEQTDIVPIIATDIVDFKGTLRIASLNGKSWDKTTGTNVTGISSKPSIVDQVSLMIESTPDLQTVGILFSPEDTDAIYQNEIFEAYLDQAGIPWKEYLIPSSEATNSVHVSQSSTALTPSKYVAYSAKQGMDNSVIPIGEDSVLGLNSTSSTRVASISQFWEGGKVELATDKKSEDDADSTKEETSSSSAKTDQDDEEETQTADTIEELITQVCEECSAIYIPFGSMLTDQMEEIGNITTDAKVTVVAGDSTVGEHALVTLFSDPYDIGYSAGKKAVRVFNGDEIESIKIGSIDTDTSVKLYNGKIAKKFDMEFPKSFKELNEFLSTYEYGSNTTRFSIVGGVE